MPKFLLLLDFFIVEFGKSLVNVGMVTLRFIGFFSISIEEIHAPRCTEI